MSDILDKKLSGDSKPFLVLLPTLFLSAVAGYLAWRISSGFASLILAALSFLAFIPVSFQIPVFLIGIWRAIFTRSIEYSCINREAAALDKMALFIPCYEEDLAEVLLRVGVMRNSLAQACPDWNWNDNYCFFIASDTLNPQKRLREEQIFSNWLRNVDGKGPQVKYTIRENNEGRKVGNLDNWFARFGDGYKYVCVLDADSLVSAQWLLRAHTQMQSDNKLALLQSMVTTAGRGTMHARMAQFGSRIGGNLWSKGSQYWWGNHGNYWGHNAILKVSAFRSSATLPRFEDGSTFLSHDIVEASLLCANGWKVRLDPVQSGSWEETPTSANTEASRSARWCKGNMQHFKILFARNLKLSSRIHLSLGILQYFSPAFFLSLLILIGVHDHFIEPISKFWLAALVGWYILINSLSIIIAAIDCLIKGKAVNFGGAVLLISGVTAILALNLSQTLSSFIAGSEMLFNVLSGKKECWKPQNRTGNFYTLKCCFEDNYKYSLAVLILAYWLTLPLSVSIFISIVNLLTSLLASPFSKPAPTIDVNARLWDTEDNLSPVQPFGNYLNQRSRKETDDLNWQEIELTKMAAD